MRTKILILIVAMALGVFCAFAVGSYLSSARKQLEAGTQPVSVLVCEQPVAAGTTAEQALADGSIVKKDVARQYVAQESISSFTKIDGQVCAVSLTPGEQVTTGDFRYAADAGAAYSLPEGHLAVSVRDDPVRGVSGFLKPGDYVSVITTFEEKQGDITTAVTRIVLARARVLAVGQALTAYESSSTVAAASNSKGALMGAGAPTEDVASVNTVTLAVKPAEVERLVFADDEGTLRLALIGTSDSMPAQTTGVRWTNVK